MILLSPFSAFAEDINTESIIGEYRGKWLNLENSRYSGNVVFVFQSISPEGLLKGTYQRATPDGNHCSAPNPVKFSGTFDKATRQVVIIPEFSGLCAETKFTLTQDQTGIFQGTGLSWFQLQITSLKKN